MAKRSSPVAVAFSYLVILVFSAYPFAAVGATEVGICYGRVGRNLPPPVTAVQLLKANGISKVRLFNPEADTLRPFAGTGVELIIGVPNEVLPALATGTPNDAARWLQANIFAIVPASQVRYLAVGNEILLMQPYYAQYLVPSLRNLQAALKDLGFAGVKLSTVHASSVLANSYPPSAGSFEPSTLPTMRPVLEFLAGTGAPFMVNIYPFFAYVNDPARVSLSYAVLHQDAPPVQDGGLVYTNLFDATVDAFVAAMEKVGFPGIGVLVAETGWATAGGDAATIKQKIDLGCTRPKPPSVSGQNGGGNTVRVVLLVTLCCKYHHLDKASRPLLMSRSTQTTFSLMNSVDGVNNACLLSNNTVDSDSEHGSLVQDLLEGSLDHELDK